MMGNALDANEALEVLTSGLERNGITIPSLGLDLLGDPTLVDLGRVNAETVMALGQALHAASGVRPESAR